MTHYNKESFAYESGEPVLLDEWRLDAADFNKRENVEDTLVLTHGQDPSAPPRGDTGPRGVRGTSCRTRADKQFSR